jgi:2-polyprenyl-6-methoxyphenol hydroxylase-like FAD-dependent oxidoreductase
MQLFDIVIAGGGLAGSTAAAMLGRRGYSVALVDPHESYPPDLRCEKLIGRQVAILRRTGLADLVLPAATLDGDSWVVQFGRVVERRGADQWGILYHDLVNAVRGTIPCATPRIRATVTRIANSADRQLVELSTGEELSARLVVIANGLNAGLRRSLGMEHHVVSKCHCLTVACDLRPRMRGRFDFRALTYFPERVDARLAYLTLFPIGSAMRANLMTYWPLSDARVQQIRRDPVAGMIASMSRLREYIGDAEVGGEVKIRPADLYVTKGHVVPGVVLVGDAFASTCPAAGTGSDKVFTDVERLCNVYVSQWLASAGMGSEKMAGYYADPVKAACDRHSYQKAFSARAMAINGGLLWDARRWARFFTRLSVGKARAVWPPQPVPASTL